jgi:hypothetical protein
MLSMRRGSHLLFATVFASIFAATVSAQLKVSSDFEGGSVKVLSVDQKAQQVVFLPGGDRKRGWPCWWCFGVEGFEPGTTVSVALDGNRMVGISSGWAMPQRAAFSTDGGKTWKQTVAGKRNGKRMIWSVKSDAPTIRFAWGPSFVPSDSAALVHRLAKTHDFAQAFELCKTREGRPVPALRVAVSKSGPVIWIQARQHAWEAGASWVCRGFVEWLCSDDASAVALRKSAEIVIVPIMDIDNTATGNGGKGQTPQDHNRDWTDAPHWPAVAAASKQIKAHGAAKRFSLFVDLHNPGPNDRQPYFYTVPVKDLTDVGRENLKRFLAVCGAEIKGPLKLSNKHRESGAKYDKNWKKISKNWVQANTSKSVVAVTLETSWNTPHSTTVGYQTVGQQLGKAIGQYVNGR